MNQGRIIVITGSPGTGKTTTASAVAKEPDLEKSELTELFERGILLVRRARRWA